MNRKCFFVSPIGEEGSEVRKNANKLKNYLILPVMQKLGIELIRADEEIHGGIITERIFEHLNKDDLVIADLTGKNPNVFLEVGYRMSTYLPMILISKKGEKRVFDVQHIQILEYGFDVEEADCFRHWLEKAAEVKIDTDINFSVSYDENRKELPGEHMAVLRELVKEYQKRISAGMSMTEARRFGSTDEVKRQLFPQVDYEDLDLILRELGDQEYIREEHADLMVMFFDLTTKALNIK